MARRRGDSQTQDLFEVPQAAAPVPASMDYRLQVSELVSHVLDETDGDRYEIASRCSRLSGKDVSKYMLDAYSSGAREEYNVPFWLVPVLESACETHEITNWLVGVRGGRLLIGRDALNAELGKLERIREQAGRQIRELKKRMGEIDE